MQASGHLVIVGVSVSAGVPINFRGKRWVAYAICGRLGPGLYVGGGATWAVGGYANNLSDLEGWNIGGGDLGMGKAVGGQATFGAGDLGITSGLGRWGAGWGASVGVDFCFTK